MRAKLFNLVNGITLIGVGAVLLDFFFTGRLDQYLHPQFRPWTLVAGVIFCVVGIVYAAAKTYARCCIDGEECVHQNANSPVRAVVAFSVLFLPLAAGVALSKDSYDQHAVLNRGFVDVSRLPGRTASAAAKTPTDQPIPPQALGADDDERASQPLPQDTPAAQPNQDLAATGPTDQAN